MNVLTQFGHYIKVATLESKLIIAERKQQKIIDELSKKLSQLESDLENADVPPELLEELKEISKSVNEHKKTH